MIRVCLDTNITSGRALKDLQPPEEMDAVEAIERLHDAGVIKRVKTKMSRIEEERATRPQIRAKLAATWDEVSVVQPDHQLLGFSTLDYGHRGFISNPIITDVVNQPVFDKLRAIGLEDADAMHIMYAVNSQCEYFVTLDTNDILPHKVAIENACPIRILKPTEFIAVIAST